MKSIGQWRCAKFGGKEHIFVKCPGCGDEYQLDHDVSVEGVVSPSLECPGADCTFHETVILACWSGPAFSANQ